MSKTILFVEDDEDDRNFVSDIMKDEQSSVNLVFAENGLKAIAYLSQKKGEKKLPCLIVLDINMPFIDGKETFTRIRQDLELKKVPIVIFTSSHNPNDRKFFAALGIEYISKPVDLTDMKDIVNHLVQVCA